MDEGLAHLMIFFAILIIIGGLMTFLGVIKTAQNDKLCTEVFNDSSAFVNVHNECCYTKKLIEERFYTNMIVCEDLRRFD